MRINISATFRSLCLAAALCGFTAAGCDNPNPAAGPTGNPDVEPSESNEQVGGSVIGKSSVGGAEGPIATDGEGVGVDPEHADEHGHEHGDHGGEIVELQPGDLDVEWSHDDESGKLTVWVAALQAANKPIDRAEVRVTGAGEPKVYALEKEGEDTYVATNAEMVTAIDASGGEQDALQSTLVIVSGGTEHTGRLMNMHH